MPSAPPWPFAAPSPSLSCAHRFLSYTGFSFFSSHLPARFNPPRILFTASPSPMPTAGHEALWGLAAGATRSASALSADKEPLSSATPELSRPNRAVPPRPHRRCESTEPSAHSARGSRRCSGRSGLLLRPPPAPAPAPSQAALRVNSDGRRGARRRARR